MNILIIGEMSYVGTHIEKWLINYGHNISTLNSRTNEWKDYDYTKVDTIIHVAAIVHQKKKNPLEVYYEVNTDLPVNIAKIAKSQGVQQVVFLSTMGIYGKEKSLPEGSIIYEDTEINPKSYYGKSKRKAEEKLLLLEEKNFKIAIVRPPNIYGKNCPGNYIKRFGQISKYIPVIPKAYTEASQSFLYIDNLSELIRLIVEKKRRGTYMPQDSDQPNTLQLLETMAYAQGKKIWFSKSLGLIIRKAPKNPLVLKFYGGIKYDPSISNYFEGKYQIVSLLEGIKKTLA